LPFSTLIMITVVAGTVAGRLVEAGVDVDVLLVVVVVDEVGAVCEDATWRISDVLIEAHLHEVEVARTPSVCT
jgi:hypothetical protein